MSHPASCHDQSCTLNYREHLLGIQISPAATPTRAVTRNEGMPDEPTFVTRQREKRMTKDLVEYKALHKQGIRPKRVGGSAKAAALATSVAQIEGRPE